MPPLVAVTFSSLVHLPEFAPRLRECLRLLLDAGANPNAAWVDPEFPGCPLSALYGAAGRTHDVEMVRMLLAAGADPNDGESLYHSLETCNPECTRLLLAAGARIPGTNALFKALDGSGTESLKLLLAHGADPNELKDWLGTPLHHAIRRGRSAEHIGILLAHGADPTLRNAAGLDAFCLASRHGLLEIAALLDRGQILSDADLFVSACARGDRAEAERLRAAVATLDESQLKVMPDLAQEGRDEAVRLMIEMGWPIDVRGGDWDATALNLAVFRGNANLAQFLLEHGARWTEEHGYKDNVMGTLSHASRARPAETGDWKACARVLVAHGMPVPDPRRYRFSDEVAGFFATL